MTWQDNPEEPIPVDESTRIWFRTWVSVRQGVIDMPNELHDIAIAIFVDNMRRFIYWSPSDEYRGEGYSNGAWKINTKKIIEKLPEYEEMAREELAFQHDTRAFPTLDAWLDAERRGQLRYTGEYGGSEALTEATKQSLRAEKLRREKRSRKAGVDKFCADCGEVFLCVDKRRIRCPSCASATVGERKRRVQETYERKIREHAWSILSTVLPSPHLEKWRDVWDGLLIEEVKTALYLAEKKDLSKLGQFFGYHAAISLMLKNAQSIRNMKND